MLKLCKFYRYLIYRIYHFSNDTPEINTIGSLTIVHLCQILCFTVIIDCFFFPGKIVIHRI